MRFKLKGEPINEVFCYCTECQQRTGSDKWFGLWVASPNLSFIQGHEPAQFTRKGASGRDVHHHFCPKCGINVCAAMTAGGFYTVAATSIDGGWPRKPKAAIYAGSAPHWAVLPQDIPVYDGLPPM
ncbi:GFA family protein [Vannielia sp. SX4]|uniref:GFA family protein n=1 Tax=Vannielia sp. SX4 TaxID=3463852 RepID=UPI004058A9A4